VTSYSDLLRDPRWQRKRLEVMQRAGFACELCGDTRTTLNVHHTQYVRGRDPWDYPAAELRCLCEPCHGREHGVEAAPTHRETIKARAGVQARQAEYDLVRILVQEPRFLPEVLEQIEPAWVTTPALRRILSALLQYESDLDRLADELDEDAVTALVKLLEDTAGVSNPSATIGRAISTLRARSLVAEMDDLFRRLPGAADEERNALTSRALAIRTDLHALGGQRWKDFR
jgi:hypothetical protein